MKKILDLIYDYCSKMCDVCETEVCKLLNCPLYEAKKIGSQKKLVQKRKKKNAKN